MAVRYGRLICVYNLGGNEAEIEVDPSVTESNPEEAILDRVKFERYKNTIHLPPFFRSYLDLAVLIKCLIILLFPFCFRIYQFAKLNYVKAATAMPKDKGNFDSSSDNSHTLLNLDPGNVVFYIGGYPRNFTVSGTISFPYAEV